MAANSSVKPAGYPLCLGFPPLAPIGVWLGIPWLALPVVFGLLPILGVLAGEDRSLPIPGLRRSRALVTYLDFLPRTYALVWIATLAWAARYAEYADLSTANFAGLILSVGISSALAIPVAHELMHRRSQVDVLFARVMTAFCLYGHMVIEHLHHHATVGVVAAGETAPRGISVYRFAPHGLPARSTKRLEG
jgi:alkane 1-monooxygenase